MTGALVAASTYADMVSEPPAVAHTTREGPLTKSEALLAEDILKAIQRRLGVASFPADRKFTPHDKDVDPMIVRRLWFYALYARDESQGLFSMHKLEEISKRDRKTIRSDIAAIDTWRERSTEASEFVDCLCDLADGLSAVQSMAGSFMAVARRLLLEDREALRLSKQKPPEPAPLLEPAISTKRPVPSEREREIDALVRKGIMARANVRQRIDLAVLTNPKATQADRREAAARLAK